MTKFDLRTDEVVLVPNIEIGFDDTTFDDELVLTNFDIVIIHRYKVGLFKKETEVIRYPVKDIKLYEGRVQASIVKNSSKPKVGINYVDKYEEYYFKDNKSAVNFLEALSKLLTGGTKNYVTNSKFDFLNAELVADALKGAVDSISDVLGIKKSTMVTKRCISCGANIDGVSNTVVKCPFCGTNQEL